MQQHHHRSHGHKQSDCQADFKQTPNVKGRKTAVLKSNTLDSTLTKRAITVHILYQCCYGYTLLVPSLLVCDLNEVKWFESSSRSAGLFTTCLITSKYSPIRNISELFFAVKYCLTKKMCMKLLYKTASFYFLYSILAFNGIIFLIKA